MDKQKAIRWRIRLCYGGLAMFVFGFVRILSLPVTDPGQTHACQKIGTLVVLPLFMAGVSLMWYRSEHMREAPDQLWWGGELDVDRVEHFWREARNTALFALAGIGLMEATFRILMHFLCR